MNDTFPRALGTQPPLAVDPYPGAQSVSRALALLKSFSDQRPEWTLADLARSVNLNKTTAYRLLAALEAEGMLARSATTGAYRLGPELIVLGSCAMRSNDLRTVSRDLLERLASESGETATLEMLSGRDVIVLDEVSSRFLLGLSQEVGARLPAHATSTGKLLLALAYDEALAPLEEFPLPQLAPRTRTSTTALRAEFPRIRSLGYATSDDELEPGFAAIAAPLYNHQGQVQAAVSIGGPISRLTGDAFTRGIEMTCRTAREISRRLGWQGRQTCP